MIIGGQFDKNGKPVRVHDPTLNGVAGANGALRHGCRRLALAQAIASGDPGSRLSAAITDGDLGTGLSFPLTGGWTSTDFAGAWPYLTFPFLDLWGNSHKGTNFVTDPRFFIIVRGTPPANSDEVYIAAALLNEADPTTGTVDGRGFGINWTGAQTVAQSTSILNGTSSSTPSASTGCLAVDCVISLGGVTGTINALSAVAGWSTPFTASSSDAVGAGRSNFPVSGPLYLHIMAGRTSAGAAGQKTVSFDVFYAPPIFVENWPS